MTHGTRFTNPAFKVVGSRPARPDGVDKVTGKARCGADASAPGQLVGLILRSPHAHALITKIDTSKAEKLQGVKAVITCEDLTDLPFIDTQILEIPNPNHPYGVRGVGETPIVPPLAAVANAVCSATGVRLTHLPMSPPRVLRALDNRQGDQA